MIERERIVILTGPTCSGKSALAVELAERYGFEIVGADSRQIYRGMTVGTAAPTAQERRRVRHHLVDFLDPYERYSAARFVEDALAALDDIARRGRRALVVGGTGFYVRALSGDVDLCDAYDEALRQRLAREARVHPPEALHEWLAARAPDRARAIQPGDGYRVLRALEIALSGEPARARPRPNLRTRGVSVQKLALQIDAEALDRRIASRVDAMLAGGILEEAERVGEGAVAANAVGYPQALAYLAGKSTHAELREHLHRATRRYAKRQRTWLRSEPGVRFVDDPAARAAIAEALA